MLAACHAGSFVRFQPQTAAFQKQVGAEVETVLEQALLTRSTLTEGDWVSVVHSDQQFDLRVQQLQPASQVSVIGRGLLIAGAVAPWCCLKYGSLLASTCGHITPHRHHADIMVRWNLWHSMCYCVA